MIAHAGGIDEMLFVLVPLIVFLTLQWLNRRKATRTAEADEDLTEALKRRHRLAGGLLPDPESNRPKADDPPDGTVRSTNARRTPRCRRDPGLSMTRRSPGGTGRGCLRGTRRRPGPTISA